MRRTWETITSTIAHSQHFIQREHFSLRISVHWRHISVGLCILSHSLPQNPPHFAMRHITNNYLSGYEEQLCFSFAKNLHCLSKKKIHDGDEKSRMGRFAFLFIPHYKSRNSTYPPLAKKHSVARKRLTCVTTNIRRLHTSQRQIASHNVWALLAFGRRGLS